MMRKPATLGSILTALTALVAAHSDPDTPGIAFHHMPLWGWAGIGTALLLLLYVMYAKTHDKPLNLLNW